MTTILRRWRRRTDDCKTEREKTKPKERKNMKSKERENVSACEKSIEEEISVNSKGRSSFFLWGTFFTVISFRGIFIQF